jgi:hypothetical protein
MAYHYLWAMRVFRTLGSVLHVSSRDDVGEYGQKTKYYIDEIHKLSPDDPYLWHDYSMLYYLQGNYFKAAHYNKKVLKTKSFQGALAIREKLKKRLFLLYYFA